MTTPADKPAFNYEINGWQTTQVPDRFGIIWDKADNELLYKQQLRQRILDARAAIANAYASAMAINDEGWRINPELMDVATSATHQAHLALRAIYKETGIDDDEATRRMLRDKSLVLNAVDNAMNSPRQFTRPWTSRVLARIGSILSI